MAPKRNNSPWNNGGGGGGGELSQLLKAQESTKKLKKLIISLSSSKKDGGSGSDSDSGDDKTLKSGKLAKKLGEVTSLPDVGPGVLHILLGKVTNLPHLTEHELEISDKSKSGGGGDLNDPYLQFGVKDKKVDSSIKVNAGSRATWDDEVLTLEVPSNDCLLSCRVSPPPCEHPPSPTEAST